MEKLKFLSYVLMTVLLCFSCNMDEFDMDKLTKTDVSPKIHAPLAYGAFDVIDYLPTAILSSPDNEIIDTSEVNLTPLQWDKAANNFQYDALDSVFLIVYYTNGTPMKMEIDIAFTLGSVSSKTFNSGLLNPGTVDATGKVVQPSVTKLEYPVTRNELSNINGSNGVECLIKLSQPDSGTVTVRNLKTSDLNIQISFRGKLSLGDLN